MEPKFPLGRAEMNWERPHRISLVDGQYLFGVVCGTEGGDGVWRGEKVPRHFWLVLNLSPTGPGIMK
jgi:hypothetical protein